MTAPVPGLDADEEMLWRSLVEVLIRLPRVLDEQFNREINMSMTEYSLLVALSEAPDGELRMGDLATATALSRSRISRVVDDMVRRSLIKRRKSGQDGRSSLAGITPEGLDRLAAAYPGHLARVRSLVLDHVTRTEMRVMTQALGRVLTALRESSDND
ncbi:MarR family winged helix-turn-helix transcriptional regulator [Plantactinospora sp. KLBMP9567]|uniref:MarR family winged helix-turn-helix transcriptional regulator n=1 Tax=Plantactinospora sp. KLBMP9567 TaxID=3085900 RepID=UPI002981F513|nr:MarR family winged helix-turn-helix transcriptional regulator [Plantactinospora sp. KLBMP9567]MDW5329930.1 MarR family winged helix-turn-helix transcriptional regulator [Plantactinospora sp. KLBMP9567]